VSSIKKKSPRTAVCIQNVYKMVEETSRVSSLHRNKANISHGVNIVWIWAVFEFNWQITFNHKFLNYAIFYSQLTFTIHVPSLIGSEFLHFIKSQFTKKCSRCSPPEPMYRWTSFRKYQGGCKLSKRHKIRVGKVSLHFQIELNTLRAVNIPTKKIWRIGAVRTWGLTLENIHWYELVLVQGTRS